MIYEVYRNKLSSDEDFYEVDAMYKRVMSEDKALCLAAHRNIEIGAFVNGELHPEKEQGPLFFQKLAREKVQEHYEEEKAIGEEIWPCQHEPAQVASLPPYAAQVAGEVAESSNFSSVLPVTVVV